MEEVIELSYSTQDLLVLEFVDSLRPVSQEVFSKELAETNNIPLALYSAILNESINNALECIVKEYGGQ